MAETPRDNRETGENGKSRAIRPIRPAASLIPVRTRPAGTGALEILMIRRAQSMTFGGGASAFPGGKVDSEDAGADIAAFPGFAALPPEDATARIAAARELFEECGILLSAGPAVAPDRIAELRRQSAAHALPFARLLADIGHRLDAARFQPFARWVPPEVPGIARYDTRFYLVATAAEPHADGGETTRARWATPAAVLSECRAGTLRLLFPTRCNVERLAQYPTAADALADRRAPVLRSVLKDGFTTIPEGLGFPYTREALSWATPDRKPPPGWPTGREPPR